jgi:hypothetical protein
MTKLLPSDIALVRAAASAAEHAPERMRAAHLAPRLEDLAERLEAELSSAPPVEPAAPLRAA